MCSVKLNYSVKLTVVQTVETVGDFLAHFALHGDEFLVLNKSVLGSVKLLRFSSVARVDDFPGQNLNQVVHLR